MFGFDREDEGGGGDQVEGVRDEGQGQGVVREDEDRDDGGDDDGDDEDDDDDRVRRHLSTRLLAPVQQLLRCGLLSRRSRSRQVLVPVCRS